MTRHAPITALCDDLAYTADLYGEHGYVEDAPAAYTITGEWGNHGADPDDGSFAFRASLDWVQPFRKRMSREEAIEQFGPDQVAAVEALAATYYSEVMQ